ncbi:hypothetical protein [Kitasatospora aureofaciens]|uniref:hypothetical protein n=1 Tax=Kitasatospora aureofaciens TaxID=1894 RepID=UPI000526EA86|nr:hypothetical protein [Kitasatospora aureofaciens]
MTSFLDELAKQLAGKWITLLVLPGALYVCAITAAWRIGLGSWHDEESVAAELRSRGGDGGHLAVVLLAAITLSAAAGLLARALGRLVHWIWLGRWPGRTGAALTRRRRRRWELAHDRYAAAYQQEMPQAVLARLAHRRNRVALAPPDRPTHIGDGLAAMSSRVQVDYGLDLEFSWPRLWLVLPEETRKVVTAARDALNGAASLAAWGILYLLLAPLWWPIGMVGLATVLVAHQQGRSRAGSLAQLMESAVDLYGATLARSLGLDVPEGRLTDQVGREITRIVRKGA